MNRPHLMLALANRWTLSVAPDTLHPAAYRIAAWPTHDGTPSSATHRWLEFKPGETEVWVTSLEEVLLIADQVGKLSPPPTLDEVVRPGEFDCEDCGIHVHSFGELIDARAPNPTGRRPLRCMTCHVLAAVADPVRREAMREALGGLPPLRPDAA